MNIKDHIRSIPDFPKPGILFYDISTLLAHAEAWKEAVGQLAEAVRPHKPDVLVGIDSRGFLVAAPLALTLGLGFVMIRKRGKLPGDIITHNYDLEYGSDTIEIQADAIKPGARVVVCDDLLATGGTMVAAINLLRGVGAEVAAAQFLIELAFLKGAEKLDVPVRSLVSYIFVNTGPRLQQHRPRQAVQSLIQPPPPERSEAPPATGGRSEWLPIRTSPP